MYKVTHALYVFPFSLLKMLSTKTGPKLSMATVIKALKLFIGNGVKGELSEY